VNGALVYLTLRSTRNRVLFRLRRLRQPRYALASLAGILYFAVIFRPGGPSRVFSHSADSAAVFATAGSLMVFLAAALAWVLPGSRKPALDFTRADVQWLFPAPLTRRELILYRVLSSQPALLASSLFLTLLMGPATLAAAGIFFAGIWLLESTLAAHLNGVSLSRRSLGAHGLAGLARQWAPLAIVSVAAVVLIATVAAGWPRLVETNSAKAAAEELQRLLSGGAAGAVLWPCRALVRVPLATSLAEFAAALPAALILLVLNLVWVIRSDAAFEEASAERAEKHAKKVAAMRRNAVILRPSHRRGTPFTLSPTGRAEIAFLWKNLILLRRQSRAMLVGAVLPLAVMAGVFAAVGRGRWSDMAAIACIAAVPMLLLTGPLAMRNDFRQDLAHLTTLKTWPVRGAAIVRGELLAPALTLSVATAVLLTAAAMLVSRDVLDQLIGPAASRVPWAVSAILIASGIAATQLVVQNAFALTFPAWTSVGDARPGVEVMGQNMVLMVASMLAFVLAVVPAVSTAAVAAFAVRLATGAIPVVVPAVAGTLVLFAQCAIAVQILGRVLERTDPTAVLRLD
jgi:ABC-2 type transport system permease protein